MNDNEAVVRIRADASQVQPGVDVAKGEVASLAPMLAQLNAQFASLATEIRASMQQGAAAAAEMAQELHHLEEETERETLSLKEMALSVHEGVESFNGMKAALSEIAEVWIAAFAVERIADWTKEFAEAAEHTEHLAQTFGMTAGQIQQLQGVAIATGISIDTITRGMQVLDKNAVQAAQGNSAVATAFKAVGISADDGATQMERLEKIADKFKDMDDGPKKVALAMELLGRSGAQLIPILNLGSEGLKELAEKAKEYDVANTAVADSAQEKGVALAESINEGKLAWQGLTNVLGDAFAPVLKEIVDSIDSVIKAMIDSYNEGGTVAVVFELIKVAVEAAGAVIDALAGIFAAVWEVVAEVVGDIGALIGDVFGSRVPAGISAGELALNIFKDVLTIVKDAVIVFVEVVKFHIDVLGGVLVAFGSVARDAFTLHWDRIGADWQAGLDNIAKKVESTAGRIQAAMDEAGAATVAMFHGEALQKAGGGVAEGKGGAGGDFDPQLGKTPKEKKPKDDLVQRLQDELDAKKLAWNLENDAHGTAIAFDLEVERKYWKDILDGTDLTAKQKGEVSRKYDAVEQQLNKEAIAKAVEGYKLQLDAAKGSSAERLAIAEKERDYIGQMLGTNSKEYEAAERQVTDIAREGAQEQVRIETEKAKAIEKLELDRVSAAETTAKFLVEMGMETKAQLIEQEMQFDAQRHDAQVKAVQDQIAAAKLGPDNVEKVKALNDQLLQLNQQYEDTKTKRAQEAAIERTAIERNAISSASSLWAQNIAKMITLQEGFAATVRSLYSGMVGIISNVLEKIIEEWLTRQVTAFAVNHGLMAASNTARVASEAAVAGAGGIASMAAAPFPLNLSAPAFGATMSASALSFAPLASAAGGWWEVDRDQFANIHKSEMILPAHLAAPMRAMIERGSTPAANNNASAPAKQNGGGHTHIHIHAHDTQTGLNFLMRNKAGVAAAVDEAIRHGYKSKYQSR